MPQLLEGSRAIALTVKMCRPGVVSAYPITPQTHIVEDLAKFKADGEADYEYVRSDSEFAAASIVLGSSAAGVRSYTATSSQGLLLMTEVLFNIAGLRLPMVITCANRAISAPLNIWNDQQDAVTIRDSGFIMLYAEDNQEAIEMHIQAFKITEATNLPVMVNVDGFVLTHTYEPVELPDENLVAKFIGEYQPAAGAYLDVKNPRSFGCFVPPKYYQEFRADLFNDVKKSAKIINQVFRDYKKNVGSKLIGGNNGLVGTYKITDAEIILVAMGSVVGTMKDAVDELRAVGVKAGILKIKSFRPFPDAEVVKLLNKAKYVAVVDKSISCGAEGILAGEIKRAGYGQLKNNIQSFITGLGGRDITIEMIKKIVKEAKKKSGKTIFV